MVDLLLGVMGAVNSAMAIPSIVSSSMVSHARLTLLDSTVGAQLFPVDGVFKAQFNPESLNVKHRAKIDDKDRNGAAFMPQVMQYKGTERDELSFELLFDESEYRSGALGSAAMALMPMSGLGNLLGFIVGNDSDVLAATRAIGALTRPLVLSAGKRYPPMVLFTWGKFAFTGYVTDVDTEYLLFDTDGNPRRAKVSVEMLGSAFTGKGEADMGLAFEGSSTGSTTDAQKREAEARKTLQKLPSAIARELAAAKKAGGGRS